MSKILKLFGASLAEALSEGAVIFPNMIFVGLVYQHYGQIFFVMPFVLLYSFEKAVLFVISGMGRIQNPRKLLIILHLTAISGSFLMCLGEIHSAFWSIGAVLLGIGLSAFNPLFRTIRDTLKERGVCGNAKSLVLGYLIFVLFLLVIVLCRYKSVGFVFFLFLLYLVAVFIFIINLNTENLSFCSVIFERKYKKYADFVLAFCVFWALFFLRLYKQTAKNHCLIGIFICGFLMLVAGIIDQKKPMRAVSAHCLWYGALRNYLAIFSLIYLTATGNPERVFYAYFMIGTGVALSKIIAPLMKKIVLQSSYELVCIILSSVSLILMVIDNSAAYMISVLLSCTFTAAGNSNAIGQFVHDSSIPEFNRRLIRYKLYNLGAVLFQLVMFLILFGVGWKYGCTGSEPLFAYTYSQGSDAFQQVYKMTKLMCILALSGSGLILVLSDRIFKHSNYISTDRTC